MRTRVFLTGEQGNLAYYVAKRFEQDPTYEMVWDYRHQESTLCHHQAPCGYELDVRDIISVRKAFERVMPNIVIHIAALVNTDRCANNPEYAYEVNTLGAYNVAKVASEAPYILNYTYFSTTATYQPVDYLMVEGHRRDPKTLYGKTKYMGELITSRLIDNPLIILPCFVYGGIRDFQVSNIARIIRNSMHGNREQLRITLDHTKCKDYMYVTDFADAVYGLIQLRRYGQYNVSRGCPTPFGNVLAEIEKHVPTKYNLVPSEDYMGNHMVSNVKLCNVLPKWNANVTLSEGITKCMEDFAYKW